MTCLKLLPAVAVCTLLISTAVFAQDGMPPAALKHIGGISSMTYPPMGGSCPTPDFLIRNRDAIGLSDAQLADLRRLDFELKRNKIVKGAAVMALELELTEIVTDPSFSSEKALSKLTEIEKARVELRSEVVKAAARATDFLDAGQKEGLKVLLMDLPNSGHIWPAVGKAPYTGDGKEDIKERMMRNMMRENMP